eukprot:3827739-Amphidinium_carterae.1
MPAFGQPVATLNGLQSFHHTCAVTDDPAGLAFFQSPQNGHEFSSKDRSPTASDVAKPTSPEVRVDPSVQTVCTPALTTKGGS